MGFLTSVSFNVLLVLGFVIPLPIFSPGAFAVHEEGSLCDFMSNLLNKKQFKASISTSNMSSTGEKNRIMWRIAKERDECVGKTTT